MYGVVTRNAPEVDWPDFDMGFYEVKDVTGRAAAPLPNAVNMVSCFGDNAAANENPELVPVDDEGNLATRDRTYFDWAYICPTNEKYRAGLLEIVEDCAEQNGDVRLDDVGFPRAEYCHCERCTRLFEESDYDDWFAWRASVITEFVAEAAERIPGRTYLTLYPDPYPGHLYERAGLDIDALAEHVDEFVVPLYDVDYGTTYWLETIAKGFNSLLNWSPEEQEGTPFSIELYAVEVDIDDLIHAVEVADAYAKDVFFGYDASNAAATLRRMKADEQEGKTFDGT
ncbi:hypothetical protein SAMN04487949_2405 [Halogranum gelatinilyticum]|uniref:Glycoside hydrolase domain protein n=1 Tax=Halogranum gelatinilyticum TaxID=660521 RepID=A0A1G9VJU1_9EURY|nr:hypothetical protein [Halogranum gelatinilyticum]SDM72367.1 hypothetical protein SAMN04487949_2405 [Halogranum gelatinilyticum]